MNSKGVEKEEERKYLTHIKGTINKQTQSLTLLNLSHFSGFTDM